jgi:hypothetical protein
VQELARPLALVADDRRGLVQALQAAEPAPMCSITSSASTI